MDTVFDKAAEILSKIQLKTHVNTVQYQSVLECCRILQICYLKLVDIINSRTVIISKCILV